MTVYRYFWIQHFVIVICKWNLLFPNVQIAKIIHHAIVMASAGKVNKLIFMGLWLFEWLNFSFLSTIMMVLNLVAFGHNQNMLLINRQLISVMLLLFQVRGTTTFSEYFLKQKDDKRILVFLNRTLACHIVHSWCSV